MKHPVLHVVPFLDLVVVPRFVYLFKMSYMREQAGNATIAHQKRTPTDLLEVPAQI